MKFEEEDIDQIVEDDGSIPKETKIYYSKFTLVIYWLIGIGLFLFGFKSVLKGELFGYVLLVISIFPLYYANKQSKISEPYLVINTMGIRTINTSLVPWENVKFIQTELRGMGKNSKCHLVIEYKTENSKGELGEDIEISELNKSPKRIEKLIAIYKQRNKVNNYR